MKKIACLSVIWIISGCIITDTPGFYNGYKKLSAMEKDSIVFMENSDPICSLDNDGKIYVINGNQLRDCLSDNDTSLVYI